MNKRFKYLVTALLLVCLVSLAVPEVNAQCAMCRATVGSNVQSGESEVGTGLNTGIFYLMSIPYILAGTIGFFWYRYSKRK